MIYIETGSDDVCYNFGAEYYFAVGRYHNVLEVVDRAYAAAHGIRIVRRMSGGGTIYTDPGGWQFTFIEDAREEGIQFQRYIAPVTGALAELGVEASFNGRNDLTVGGKKISGNAQYRLGGRVVHHGSLLFDTDLEQMAAATTVDRERVTNIAWHLPAPMDAEAFKAKIVEHILGPEGTVYVITPEDGRRIRELGEERFASWESTYGQGPAFNIERVGRFSGGTMRFRLEVKRGVIRQAAVSGDFFATLDGEAFGNALAGCRYERDAVRAALEALGADGTVYRVSAEEMAKAIVD